MVNLLPAVLVGGPPHAGKSVLFYRLAQELRARGIEHYALRACPDDDANWFHEADPTLANHLRTPIKGKWPPVFMQQISQAIEHRSVPFLVDMGGRPTTADEYLLDGCTHSILLVREDLPADTRSWQGLVENHNLLPLARIFSRQKGESVITARSPILEGVITGLERDKVNAGAGAGPLFDELLARIIALFTSPDLAELKALHLKRAPTALVCDIEQEVRTFTTTGRWTPAMLAPLLARWSAKAPLSVYGSGPLWVYAALAAYKDPQPFYLYDPKVYDPELPLGWAQPIPLSLNEQPSHTDELQWTPLATQEYTRLKISLPQNRLAYRQPDPLSFPPIPLEHGLFIDGKLPMWLVTALTRLYKNAGVAWIATYEPRLHGAVVVYSRVVSHQLGSIVASVD